MNWRAVPMLGHTLTDPCLVDQSGEPDGSTNVRRWGSGQGRGWVKGWGRSLVVILALIGTGCAGIEDATLRDLTVEQEQFDGRVVRTQGVVRTFDEPRHYWIEDQDLNRVELLPTESVEELVGTRITVEGRFTFRDDEGRRIAVDRLTVLAP